MRRFMMIILVLLLLPSAAGANATLPPRTSTEFRMGAMGGLSAGIGSPLWAGGDAKLEHRFLRKGIVGARGKLALANDEEGSPLGGYRLNGFFGFDWCNSHHVSHKWLVHGGVVDAYWVPMVNFGLTAELAITPLYFDHFRWTFAGEAKTEFPFEFAGDVWTEFLFPLDVAFFGFRLTWGFHAGVPNLVGTGLSGKLLVGWSF